MALTASASSSRPARAVPGCHLDHALTPACRAALPQLPSAAVPSKRGSVQAAIDRRRCNARKPPAVMQKRATSAVVAIVAARDQPRPELGVPGQRGRLPRRAARCRPRPVFSSDARYGATKACGRPAPTQGPVQTNTIPVHAGQPDDRAQFGVARVGEVVHVDDRAESLADPNHDAVQSRARERARWRRLTGQNSGDDRLVAARPASRRGAAPKRPGRDGRARPARGPHRSFRRSGVASVEFWPSPGDDADKVDADAHAGPRQRRRHAMVPVRALLERRRHRTVARTAHCGGNTGGGRIGLGTSPRRMRWRAGSAPRSSALVYGWIVADGVSSFALATDDVAGTSPRRGR